MSGRRAIWVGRDRELARLEGVLADALDGRGGSALAVGEAGIGKTRLLEELAERARARGFAVAWGRAWELGGAPSFWPWVELMRTLAARPFAPPSFVERWRPLLLERDAGAPTGDVFQLFDAVQSHLRAHAELEPLALFIDDLHAVDPSSLMLAELVARGLSTARIALFGGQRDAGGESATLGRGSLRLARASERVELGPLTQADVSSWMQQGAGAADADSVRRIYEASDGNPLFVSELLRLPALASHGFVAALPPTLRAVIRERLGVLSAKTLELSRAAALLGRQFSAQLLAHVTGATPADIEVAAREARELGVLNAAGPDQYRFSHVLVAETLVFDLEPALRLELHARAAERLEQRHAGDPLAPLHEIARHWLAAGVDAAPRAVIAAERAASQAMARLGFADAALWYERAGAALASCSPLDVRRQTELLLSEIEALSRSGRRDRAELACARAVELARSLGDGELLARAALALGAESHLGSTDLTITRLLERALVALPEEDGALRALVSARLAAARQPALDPEAPMALARDAVAMARRLADATLRLQVIHAALGALMDFAPAEERAVLNAEALELATQLGDRPRALSAAQRLAFDRIELGDGVGFEQALARHEVLAAEVGQPRYGWVPAMFRAMRADWQGDRSRADYWEAEARSIREQGGGEGAALVPERALCRALLHLDEGCLAQFVAGRAARSADASGTIWLSALQATWRGQPDAAGAGLDTLAARGLGRFVGRPASSALGVDRGASPHDGAAVASDLASSHAIGLGYLHMPEIAVELACHRGDVAWANALYAELLPSAGKPFLVTTLGFSLHGSVDHALMRLSAVAQSWDVARRHASNAIELCSRLRARPLLARIHLDACTHACAERERVTSSAQHAELTRAATEHLGRARALARELGWNDWLDRCASAERALQDTPGRVEPPDEPRPGAARGDAGGDRGSAASGALRLVLEGEYWTLTAGAELCRIADGRGMQMLARLVEQPGRELHVLELSGSALGVAGSDAGEVLDGRARAEYQGRLRELKLELDEAEAFNDMGRRERLAAEAEALVRELSRGFGLGGRSRRSASVVERARVNVRRRLTLALRHIRAASPALGEHLEASLRTGVRCVYLPSRS
ncbi:MAG TPA: AAA family ATPase [Polyangiaceae bacterium]|nr:AAA family ATPase [Polyangiaceae bacterium]